MRAFYLFDYRIWVTILLSVCLGWLWSLFAPVFNVKPVLMVAVPFAILFFLMMVTKPKWVMLLIIVTRPLLDVVLNATRVNNGAGGGDGVGMGLIFNLTVVFMAVFLAFYSRNYPHHLAPLSCWVIYLLCMLATVLYSPDRGDSIRLWWNYLSYFALFLIPFLMVRTQEDFVYWIKVLGISFVLPIFCADVDMARGGQYFEDAGMRITGTFTHPNILAFYLVLAFTFYFYILKAGYLKSSPGLRVFVKLLMIDILVLLVSTKTRNAWISIYIGFIIYAILKQRKMLILLFVVVPLMFFLPPVQDRMLTVIKDEGGGDYHGVNSFTWRMQLWQSSFAKIAERPLQGYGLDTFKYMSGQFSSNKKMGAHNTYIELLFETGIIGLLSFLALFISPLIVFFRNMRQSENRPEAQVWAVMIGYVISYLLICSADNLLFYLVFNWYVWFFLGLMLVASHRKFQVYA